MFDIRHLWNTFFLFLQRHRCNFTSVWMLRNRRTSQKRPQEFCSPCRCEGTWREPERAQQDEVAQWSSWSSGEAERLDIFNDLTPMTHKTCHSNLEAGSEIAAVLTKLLVVHVQNVISSFIGYLIRGLNSAVCKSSLRGSFGWNLSIFQPLFLPYAITV